MDSNSRSPVSGDTPQRPLITSLAIIFPQSSASPSHRRLRPRRGKILAPSRCMPLVRSMLRRKRKKPLAGARSFPAVRHEPMNRDEGLARAGAADRQGVPLLGGERPVGCALLCRKSLRQRLAAPLFFGLGLRDTADKTSDRQACRDSHPRWVSLQPILVLAQKIANLTRTRSLVMATVPGGGGNPSIVARIKRPTVKLASTAPVLMSSTKCFRNDFGSSGLPV
jgi:hypothetical protein